MTSAARDVKLIEILVPAKKRRGLDATMRFARPRLDEIRILSIDALNVGLTVRASWPMREVGFTPCPDRRADVRLRNPSPMRKPSVPSEECPVIASPPTSTFV